MMTILPLTSRVTLQNIMSCVTGWQWWPTCIPGEWWYLHWGWYCVIWFFSWLSTGIPCCFHQGHQLPQLDWIKHWHFNWSLNTTSVTQRVKHRSTVWSFLIKAVNEPPALDWEMHVIILWFNKLWHIPLIKNNDNIHYVIFTAWRSGVMIAVISLGCINHPYSLRKNHRIS
jgi:hypothetical protein